MNESRAAVGQGGEGTDDNPQSAIRNPQSGDMPAEEFRRYGRQVVDWIADYLENNGRYPVLSQVEPGYLKNALPAGPPARGEDFEQVLADVDRLIVPGVTHWNHPGFHAYFAISGSAPGILGEMFAAAFNVNAMMWYTSPAATELEEVTIDWLRQLLGLPDGLRGVIYDTASISTLCAVAAAREAVPGVNVREAGLSGQPRLRLYTSEHAHSSVERAAITLGLGQQGVRQIPADAEYRMRPGALAEAIAEDRAAGWLPFCVVATVGTTSTTSIDPVAEIADICEREKLWLHVDAAYGGSAAVAPEYRQVLAGGERGDSLVVNPHKWLFVPVDLSVLYCKRMGTLKQAFSLLPEYLRTADTGQEVENFMDYGPQLGRRFRALKLWFVMRYFGAEGLAARLREHIELAQDFARWVDEHPDFERTAPTPLALVCFRARPAGWTDEAALDRLNQRLLEAVNREGSLFLSHTRLGGKYTLRLVVGNIRTTREHLQLARRRLTEALAALQREPDTVRIEHG